MSDVLTPSQRRRVMSRIRAKDTRPEILIRRGLHGRGLRFRIHREGMPGKPDIVLPKYSAVVLVNGCFWHGHSCSLFRLPKTRAAFWEKMISGNRARDVRTLAELGSEGWRVLVVWECAVKGRHRRALVDVINEAEAFVRGGGQSFAEIQENDHLETPPAKRMRSNHPISEGDNAGF